MLQIESSEDTASVMETLSMVSDATKQLKLDADEIDQALSDLSELREEHERVNSLFDLQSSEKDDLLRELEKLSLGDDAERIETEKQTLEREKVE